MKPRFQTVTVLRYIQLKDWMSAEGWRHPDLVFLASPSAYKYYVTELIGTRLSEDFLINHVFHITYEGFPFEVSEELENDLVMVGEPLTEE